MSDPVTPPTCLEEVFSRIFMHYYEREMNQLSVIDGDEIESISQEEREECFDRACEAIKDLHIGSVELGRDETSGETMVAIHVGCPGLIIGKKGENYDQLRDRIGCVVEIHECNPITMEIISRGRSLLFAEEDDREYYLQTMEDLMDLPMFGIEEGVDPMDGIGCDEPEFRDDWELE